MHSDLRYGALFSHQSLSAELNRYGRRNGAVADRMLHAHNAYPDWTQPHSIFSNTTSSPDGFGLSSVSSWKYDSDHSTGEWKNSVRSSCHSVIP